jgi:hypothetical protein
MTDPVVQPAHYTQGGVECIDALRAALGSAGFAAYCAGNIIKYVWRYKHKNGLQDLQKAAVYLTWLRDTVEVGPLPEEHRP